MATETLRAAIDAALPERPFTVRLWDGTELPSVNGGPTFTLRSPEALGHIIRAPGQLGVGRAYVRGAIDVDSVEDALSLLDSWSPPPIDARAKARIAAGAVRAGALRSVPRVPDAELRPRGRRHSIARDKRSVRHHYDVSNEFFELFLGPSMTYSCAIFSRGAKTLEEAQETKLELVCTKLGLQPGMRVLDVGCGWGSFALHAASRHGAHVTGITLSEPQAARARERAQEAKLELVCTKLGLQPGMRVLDVGCGWGSFALHAASRHGAHVTGITLSEPQAARARERAQEAGVADKVEFRVQDYRELGGETFDRVASIGMVEHVGAVNIDAYVGHLYDALRPGGLLLNHGIARLRHGDPEAGPFSERFVFPDAAPLHLSRIIAAMEAKGFVTDHVEGFAPDYAETLRHWARRLDERIERATQLAGPERVRVWRLYVRAARRGFESGFTSVYQVRAQRL